MNIRAAALAALLFVPGVAWADPATHTFVISAAQSGKGDCGGGTCANNCKLQGKITNVSPHVMNSATLQFKYPHPGLTDGNLAILAFNIPALQPGESQVLTEWVYGLKCGEVQTQSPSAKCDSSSCPYGAIRISKSVAPRISAAKIDINP